MTYRNKEAASIAGKLYYAANKDKILAKQRQDNWSAAKRFRKTRKYVATRLKRIGINQADIERAVTDLFDCRARPDAMCPLFQLPMRELHGPATDHNHKTGAYRGIISDRANRILGLVNDDPAILRRMADYLDKHN